MVLLLVIIITSTCVFGYLSKSIEESVVIFAKADAYTIVIDYINDIVYNYLNNSDIKYFDIVTLEKNSDERVTAILINSVKLNRIKSEISKEIIDKITEIEAKEYGIPIGTVLKSTLFSGRGFKIYIKIIPLGAFTSSIDNKFTSVGINQSVHSIYLNFNAVINVVAPFSKASISVTDRICISETVLLGDVPNTYIQIKDDTGNDYIKYFKGD
ncbi:MAG: sporulation protein YunB [Clostridiales bacterium GWF2_38_85]|nr:MAG: sporulation protein YunB [Clostridiales bacterium GWF2_38_85]